MTGLHRRLRLRVLCLITMLVTHSPLFSSSQKELHVIGLFGKTGDLPVGEALQRGAELAIEDINKRNDVLANYTIVLHAIDTEGMPVTALVKMISLLNVKPVKYMVLGGTSSEVTTFTAQLSRRMNLVQISYAATDPTLSKESQYSWFFRTSISEDSFSQAFILLMRHLQWTCFHVVQQSFRLFTTREESLRKLLKQTNAGIQIASVETFHDDVQIPIETLKTQDARIIYLLSNEGMAVAAMCEAYNKGFYGPRRVWIFPSFFTNEWYNETTHTNCSSADILKVIDGYLTFVQPHPDEEETVSNMTGCSLYTRYTDSFGSSVSCQKDPGSFTDIYGWYRVPLVYDAMWAVALALNGTLEKVGPSRLENFDYTDEEMGQIIMDSMKAVSFQGVTGRIKFDSNGDRPTLIAVLQFNKDKSGGPGGHFVEVGSGTDKELEWEDNKFRWQEGLGPPVSIRPIREKVEGVSLKTYLIVCLLAALGIIVSLCLLAFNIKFRDVRVIKMSSPSLNDLSLVGCLGLYTTIFIEDINLTGSPIFCHAKKYAFILGLSLAYGALFCKTWRVYKIMTPDPSFRAQDVRDEILFLRIGVYVAFSLSLLILWSLIDPFWVVKIRTNKENIDDSRDVKEIFVNNECKSKYSLYFNSCLVVVESLLMLFGAFLAWHTRKVTIRELNDSRWIGLCIYTYAMLGCVDGVLWVAGSYDYETMYVLQSLSVFIGATVTQSLIFIPKIIAFRRGQELGTQDFYFGSGSTTFRFRPSISTATTKATTLQLPQVVISATDLQVSPSPLDGSAVTEQPDPHAASGLTVPIAHRVPIPVQEESSDEA